jgi:hypothetical protein
MRGPNWEHQNAGFPQKVHFLRPMQRSNDGRLDGSADRDVSSLEIGKS